MRPLVIILISILFLQNLNSQSLTLSDSNGDIPNNSDVNYYGGPDDLLTSYVFVTNNSAISIDVKVKKVELDIVPGSINYFCWGMCFPPEVYVSPYPISIASGETNDSDFSGDYMPNGAIGTSKIRYVFFDDNNPSDSVCVNVLYHIMGYPELTSIFPNKGNIPEILNVVLSGENTNFLQGSGTTTVWLSLDSNTTIYPNEIDIQSSVLIYLEFIFNNNHIPGIYDVNTNNELDGHLILEDGFDLDPNPFPYGLLSVTPNTGNQGEVIVLSVWGENTHFTQGNTEAYLVQSGVTYFTSTNIEIISDDNFQAEFELTSGYPTGLFDLKVVNTLDATMFLYDAFILNPNPDPPYLASITPDNGTIPETLSVSVDGVNTHFSQGTGTVLWLQQGSSIIYPTSITEISNTLLEAEFTFSNFNTTGLYDVNTMNGLDGELTLSNSFYLNPDPDPPQLVSIEPDSAQLGELLSVSISGLNTNFTQGTGTTVWLNQESSTIYPINTTIINNELISADFTIYNYSSTGYYNVNTHNSFDGTLTLANGFYIYPPAPVITYIYPEEGYQGEEIIMTIYGENTHFEDGDNLNIWFSKDEDIKYPENFMASGNGTLIVNFVFPYTLPLGGWDINISNDIDGVITVPDGFELLSDPNQPELASIDPDVGYLNQVINVNISGLNTHFNEDYPSDIWLNKNGQLIEGDNIIVFDELNVSTEFTIPSDAEPGVWDLNTENDFDGHLILENSFTIIDTSTFSKEQEGVIKQVKIHPNPSKGEITLSVQLSKLSTLNIQLFSVYGNLITEFSYKNISLLNTNYSLVDLPSGIYYLRLMSDDQQLTRKIIKK